MRCGGTQFFGFGGGSGGTGSVPIANNQAALLGFGFFGFGGGSGGTGSVPIANDQVALLGFRFFGFGGGPGGSGGTGSVPIANNTGLSPVATVPATARRSETAVKATSNASRTLRASFFIEALRKKIVVPARRGQHTGEPMLS